MLLEINPENPQKRYLEQIKEIVEKGGIIIYPTDTVYALGCSINNQKAVERICRLRKLDPVKANLTIICKSISQVSEFTLPIPNESFKIMKRLLPGPYTFILKSNNTTPKIFKNKKRTIGVRIPENQIVQDLLDLLGTPILTTSLKSDDEILEYFTDATEIHDEFQKLVDCVIDGGPGKNVPSTVVGLTENEPVLIRQGLGEWEN